MVTRRQNINLIEMDGPYLGGFKRREEMVPSPLVQRDRDTPIPTYGTTELLEQEGAKYCSSGVVIGRVALSPRKLSHKLL